MKPHTLLKLEEISRAFRRFIPPKKIIAMNSSGRKKFLEFFNGEGLEPYEIPRNLEKVLWGIRFRSPLMNAAGMFKNGEAVEISAKQGSGAYLGGTTTFNSREGNSKQDINQPFVYLPDSGAGLNCLGLPNEGHTKTLSRIQGIKKTLDIYGCPLGWSVALDPHLNQDEGLMWLVKSMNDYEIMGVDFLELNDSCPNTETERKGLEDRLIYVRDNFLQRRTLLGRERPIPLIVKFSNDTPPEKIPYLMNLLVNLEFDGVNFGNTSTGYKEHKKDISKNERRIYDKFTEEFWGGLSGRPLKEDSLELCAEAVRYINSRKLDNEFHVIRTGGIETAEDILKSERAGISLNQWYTGYWGAFRNHGHDLYKKIYEEITSS